MKIGLCGPSGTGKTTLALSTAKAFNLEYMPLSASIVYKHFGKDPEIENHRQLINKHAENSDWGIDFQLQLSKMRQTMLEGKDNVIVDRTPIDNYIYFMLEAGHNADKELCDKFFQECVEFAKTFDIIIFVPFCSNYGIPINPQGKIEDNGKRITNPHFQEMVSVLFDYYIGTHFYRLLHGKTLLAKMDFWDFAKREATMKACIQSIGE